MMPSHHVDTAGVEVGTQLEINKVQPNLLKRKNEAIEDHQGGGGNPRRKGGGDWPRHKMSFIHVGHGGRIYRHRTTSMSLKHPTYALGGFACLGQGKRFPRSMAFFFNFQRLGR